MSHIYVCLFNNGLIKIGRSDNPTRRIKQHADRVSCVGVTLISSQEYMCVGNSLFSETDLLEKCKAKAEKIFNREWFSGLVYEDVCAFAEESASKHFAFGGGKLIGEKVKDLLLCGFTQKELAIAIGVAQSTISDLSTGKHKDIGIEGGGRLIEHLHTIHCSKAA